MSKKTIIICLSTITLIGLFLRILGFEHITWTYDQSRDVIEAVKIITSGDYIKIQGPMTDIPGIFHGALYWYILAPFVYLNGGMPYLAKFILVLINLACIPALYYITSKMFNDKRIGFLASFLFAISFEAVQYARWMSNPAPALISTLFSMYGLWLMTKKDIRGIIWFLLSWPISIQFQFVLAYQIVFFIPILLWNFRIHDIRKNWKNIAYALFGFFALVSPFIVGLIKYKFQSIISLFSYLTSKEGGGRLDIFALFAKIIDYFYYSAFSLSKNFIDFNNQINLFILCLFMIVVVFYVFNDKKNRRTISFLIFWIFSPFAIYYLDTLHAYFLTLGNLFGFLILIAYILVKSAHSSNTNLILRILTTFIVLFAVIFSNVKLAVETSDDGEVLFAIQKKAILSDIKKVIDTSYMMADKKMFALDTVTNPLFINTTWAYAYEFYGKSKYGYLPVWKGVDQKGRYGDAVEFGSTSPQTGMMLIKIVEPQPGIPDAYVNAYETYENRRSKLLDIKHVGNYVVEKRVFTNEMGLNIGDISNEILLLNKE